MSACPHCGAEIPGGFRFCGDCGHRLDQPPARRERRLVSVLFADLVGFTRRAEQLDVEDVERMLAPYHDAVGEELAKRGGVLAKTSGDGVMALFGATVSHEDDAERAVRAGLGLIERLDELQDAAGVAFQIRIGVATGEALIRSGEDGVPDAFGDVVNTAARLESAAPVNALLVDRRTQRASAQAFEYQSRPSIAAKGKAEPVAVWRPLRTISSTPNREEVDEPPLVGRARELDVLRAALERSHAEPSAQLVTVVGAPGIGKSRLIRELEHVAHGRGDRLRWRHGRSLAYGEGIALWALREIVVAEAGILTTDPPSGAAAKIEAVVDLLPIELTERQWVLRTVGSLVGVGAWGPVEGGEGEAISAWRRFVEALAETGPTVLVFDDLHWADDTLLEFVDQLADRAGAVPLLIVCTARPELLDRRPMWGGGKLNATSINLTPLSAGETLELARSLAPGVEVYPDFADTLLRRADGVPLYVREWVRMFEEHRDAAAHAVADALPETLQALIAARLDTLDAERRRFLQAAAVVGRTASIGAVNAVASRSGDGSEELVHDLERKQLIRRVRRSGVSTGVEFTFMHALIRDVAYGQISRDDRQQLHLRAAEWIEGLVGERDDAAEVLAYHYTTALELRRQGGDEAVELVPQVGSALAGAGRRAAAVRSHASAARYLRHALELTPSSSPLRLGLLLDLATELQILLAPDGAVLSETLETSIAVGDPESIAWAELLLGQYVEDALADGAAAERHYERAASYAERVAPSDRTIRIAETLAYRLAVQGRQAESLVITDRAIREATAAGLADRAGMLTSWHGSARIDSGDRDGGIDEMAEAARMLAAQNHSATPEAHGNFGYQMSGLGELAAAADLYEQAVQWARRLGNTRAEQIYSQLIATVAHIDGRWDEAVERALAWVGAETRYVDAMGRSIRGRIALARGAVDDARVDADRAVDYAASARNHEMLLEALAQRTLVNDTLDDDPTGADEFLDLWAETHGLVAHLPHLAEVAPLLVRHGREGDLRKGLAIVKVEHRWREPILALCAHRCADAAEGFRAIGSHTYAAAAHLLGTELAQRDGDIDAARRHAANARAFYQQVGASLLLARIEALVATA